MSIHKKHKWNGKAGECSGYKCNGAVACVKCGMIKEFIHGIPTYFIDDTLRDRYAPDCDERILKTK
jgi:hypothetical protein